MCLLECGARDTAPASSRSRPTRSTATSRRAAGRSRTTRCDRPARTAPRRPAATCRCSRTSAPTACARRSRAARTPTARTSIRRSSSRSSSRTRSTASRCRSTATASRCASGSTPRTTAPAIELVLHEGAPGEIYNVGGEDHENIEVTHRILELTGADPSLIRHVEDRAGHDRRYALDDTKLRALGWRPQHSFGEGGLPETVDWYRDNRAWWEPIKSGAYRAYYDEQYANRLKA